MWSPILVSLVCILVNSLLIHFSYTCGKVWQTCRCTDRDEDRRDREIRARLAQYEANQRAEEEEAKAAAAAIEGAERQLREEREAQEAHFQQEAREIARRETERTQQIAEYFQYLRGVMERVRLHQTWAIDKRHYREWAEIDNMKNQLESPEIIAEREAYVKSERDKIHNSTETTIKSLQRQHAAVMLETMNRHRRDQDDLFARPIDSEDQDAEILKMETLQELIPVQDLERTALKVQQAREVEKWRNRGDASLRAFDSKMIGLKMRLEDAERIKKREMEIRDLVFADGKWTETIFEDRLAMLAEDEQKMVRNGGEAPAAPRRETVTMPSREIPCLQLDTKNQGDSSPATTPSNKKKEAVGLLEMLVKEAADRPSHVSRVPAPRWNRFGDDVIMEERRATRSSTFVLKV